MYSFSGKCAKHCSSTAAVRSMEEWSIIHIPFHYFLCWPFLGFKRVYMKRPEPFLTALVFCMSKAIVVYYLHTPWSWKNQDHFEILIFPISLPVVIVAFFAESHMWLRILSPEKSLLSFNEQVFAAILAQRIIWSNSLYFFLLPPPIIPTNTHTYTQNWWFLSMGRYKDVLRTYGAVWRANEGCGSMGLEVQPFYPRSKS